MGAGKTRPRKGGARTWTQKVRQAIFDRVAREPFAQKFGLRLTELEAGYSKVEMTVDQGMENIFGIAHGGALFALIDEAFETASNSHGTIAVALNMNVGYLAPAKPGDRLTAEAKEYSLTRKTATYDIKVSDAEGRLIASCNALVFRKGAPLPFL